MWLNFMKRTLVAVGLVGLLSNVFAYGQGMDIAAQRALVDQYCVSCHNSRTDVGKRTVRLDELNAARIGDNLEAWEKVVRKVRAGMMPPTGPLGARRPDQATVNAFVKGLETELDRASMARGIHIAPPGAHRLNRTEYRNSIRDLLDLEIDATEMLPVDDSVAGFDNVAAGLGISSSLTDAYVGAAEKISRLAMGTETVWTRKTYRSMSDYSQSYQVPGLAFGTRGGMLARHYFPVDGEYGILWNPVTGDGGPYGTLKGEQLEITLDGERIRLWDIDKEIVGTPRADDDPGGDTPKEVRVFIKAGMHEVGAAFLARNYAPLTGDYDRHWKRTLFASRNIGGFQTATHVSGIDIQGPYAVKGAGDTPSRRRILLCKPADAAEEAPCARRIVTRLAGRAFRRPSKPQDVDALMKFYQIGHDAGGFEKGIETALLRILADPEFIYRTEVDPAGVAKGQTYWITDLELASRLSFFLWSSIPDDELISLAAQGKLRDATVLKQQVQRMLADSRSRELTNNFAGQWLGLRALPSSAPAAQIFPDFDDTLRQAFRREAELFFESIVREDRNVVDLLTADYTFVNERLAEHYRIPNIYGPDFRRVTLGKELDARRGLLGKGAILTSTSLTNRTSPVARGKWVMMNILGTVPPEPPPNVPELETTANQANGAEVADEVSVRARMEAHRTNPVCASCHRIMDPIGFSLESFDGIGMWRTRDGNDRVDPSGTFVDGTNLDGVSSLRETLAKYSDQFVQTLTEKLLTYAVGRAVDYQDMPAVRSIVRKAAAEDYRLSSIIWGIVSSDVFQRNTKL
jgi:cytochrome c553